MLDSLQFALVYLVFPGVILIGAFTLLLRRQWRRPPGASCMTGYVIAAAGFVTFLFLLYAIGGIANSRASTAAIGYYFLPMLALAVAGATAAIGWSALTLIALLPAARERLVLAKPHGLAVALAASALIATAVLAHQDRSRDKLLREAGSPQTPIERLRAIAERALKERDADLLAALAVNRGIDIALLAAIHERCGADGNTVTAMSCYAPQQALAGNERTPPAILASLAARPEAAIRVALATNRSTPVDTLAALSDDRDSLVRAWVATNPQLPRERLAALARDDDKVVRDYAQNALRREPNQ